MNEPLWRLECALLPGRHRPRLDTVTLDIPAGVTAILGPSGAGKSSLLGLLAGFESIHAGRIVRCFDAPEGRLPLFWAPPNDGLWPHLTVGAHLREVLPSRLADGSKIVDLLSSFDLEDKIDALPDQLSQGEAQRLALARALAADPAVLVLDEPLVHVDPAREWKYWDLVQKHRRERAPVSIVFSTHSPETVIREAENVVCLDEGRVVYSGSVQQLYSEPPSAELAWSLGPINWVAAAECPTWLKTDAPALKTGVPADRRLRPEQLGIAPCADSSLVVEGARICGGVAEIDLLDEQSGQQRRFFHRPEAQGWRPGDRVLLKVLALLLSCLLSAGCAESSAAPQLPVRGVTTWSVPANGASIPAPRAVHATAAGEIYVLDNAGRVLVYDENGKILRQWWMPDYSVGRPEKIVRLRDGRLVVADTHYHRIVFFNDQGEVLEKRGSLGHEPGQYIYPVAVVEDDSENLYVGEYGDNDRVQKFDKEGNFLLQFGSQGTLPGQFQRPSGMLWHAGKIYIVDAFNNRIQVFSEAGEFLEVLGGAEGNLNYPYDIAMSAQEELFVVEYAAGRVSKFDLGGKLLGRFGVSGSSEGEFSTPWGMTVDAQSRVFVADTGNRRVVRLEL
jgi:iron(III) transport system ATP-binding protein